MTNVASLTYADRAGYNSAFLGVAVPLPRMSLRTRRDALDVSGQPGADGCWLHYENFSLVMSASRRFALATAANVSATERPERKPRRPSNWFDDPRVSAEHQVGSDVADFYGDEPYNFDRGHLVRREDPIWGNRAAIANRDSHHYTNCSPQHQRFNQDNRGWRAVEEHVASQLAVEHGKLSVFTGPVFADDDPVFGPVLVPLDFWKVIVTSPAAGLVAVAFRFTQRGYLQRRFIERERVNWLERIQTHQVAVSVVERATGLSFGLDEADPLAHRSLTESERARPISRLADITL